MKITDRDAMRPLEIFVHAACILRELHPDEFVIRPADIDRMTGTAGFRTLYRLGAGPEEILEDFGESLKKFRETRKEYLLY